MSDSLRPHGLKPTRLVRPWDFPGKSAGVGCHSLLQYMKVKLKVKSLSHAQLLATPWTVAYQAPPPMGFSRQEYWSGVPLPSPIHTLLYIKQITNKDLLYSTGNSTQYSIITNMEKESEKKVNVCICITESLCYLHCKSPILQ